MTKKTVLITGCSTGFGKLTAQTFMANDWNVVATMRRPENEEDLQDGESVLIARLDVTDEVSITAAVQAANDRFDGIDALVNNAGYGGHGIFEQWPVEPIRAMFETNVFGTMNVCRAVLPQLVYSAAKYALEGFTEAMAIDYAPLGVTVRSVLPGAYPTAFSANTQDFTDRGDEEVARLATAFRAKMGSVVGSAPQDPQEVADLVYACVTEDDLPTHNPCGADARMLVDMMSQGTRQDFINGISAMLAPDFDAD